MISEVLELSSGDKVHIHRKLARNGEPSRISLFVESNGRTTLMNLSHDDAATLLEALKLVVESAE